MYPTLCKQLGFDKTNVDNSPKGANCQTILLVKCLENKVLLRIFNLRMLSKATYIKRV